MSVLGVDFGTSNTVAMLRSADGRVRPLLFNGSPLLPSAVYLGTNGQLLIGRDAERNARVDPGRFEPNPKRRIDDVTILLGDAELPVHEVIAAVLGQLAAEASRQAGRIPDELRMTHPARWAERRRGVLIAAAAKAGLPRPKLIPEPVAAAAYFTSILATEVRPGRSLAIYDLGGGTFDATVVRRTLEGFEVLAEGGIPELGGLDFDHAVVQHLGDTYRQSHPESWDRLQHPRDGNDRRQRRLLWEDVRGAKEMLSRTSSADLHLPELEVDAHLVREEFEHLIQPFLDRTVSCLLETIAAAKLVPAELAGIFLVGGSSRIPLAAHLIHSRAGIAPTTLEQPETVVAEGSLWAGVSGPRITAPSSPVPRMPAPSSPVPRMPPPPPPVTAPQRPSQHDLNHRNPNQPSAPSRNPAIQNSSIRDPSRNPSTRDPAQRGPVLAERRPPQVPLRPLPLARPTVIGQPQPLVRAWYQEPTVIVALVVAAAVLLVFLFILIIAVA
jgi:molecular chaperone DnaK (HSP70)